jgi:DNA-binding MarR family transcriptional regulator
MNNGRYSNNNRIVAVLIIFLLLAVASLLVLSLPAASQSSRQDLDPNYSIDLEKKVVYVDVSAEQGGYISINGTVSISFSTDVKMFLDSYVLNSPWRTLVTPLEMEFFKNGPTEKEFTVELWVPHGIKHDVSEFLQVNGTWEKLGILGSIAPDQAVVNILQFSSVSIQPQFPYQEFEDVGATLEFPLVLQNTGNGADTFEMDFKGLDGTEQDLGIGNTLALEYGEVSTLPLKIDLPASETLTEYRISVTATSLHFGTTESIDITVYIEEGRAFIASALGPVLIVRHGFDINSVDIENFVNGGERTVTVNIACYLWPMEEITLTLSSADGFEITDPPAPFSLQPGERRQFTINIEYTRVNESLGELGSRVIVIQATGYSPDSGEYVNSNTLRMLTSIRRAEKQDSLMDSPYVAPVAGGIAATVIALVAMVSYASSETGKYKLLGLLFIPLYTKLHKDKILDHFARGRLFEYIKLNPGVTFTALKSELDMGNGTLTYHLKTLEREELVKSTKDGRNRCFYLTGTKVHTPGLKDDIMGALSGVDSMIYEMICNKPGISQHEIFTTLEEDTSLAQRTVSNHIKMMERRGLIQLRRDGKNKRCYLVDMPAA